MGHDASRLWKTWRFEQVFSRYSHPNHPKGNAETEDLMRPIKDELRGLREFVSVEEA